MALELAASDRLVQPNMRHSSQWRSARGEKFGFINALQPPTEVMVVRTRDKKVHHTNNVPSVLRGDM